MNKASHLTLEDKEEIIRICKDMRSDGIDWKTCAGYFGIYVELLKKMVKGE